MTKIIPSRLNGESNDGGARLQAMAPPPPDRRAQGAAAFTPSCLEPVMTTKTTIEAQPVSQAETTLANLITATQDAFAAYSAVLSALVPGTHSPDPEAEEQSGDAHTAAADALRAYRPTDWAEFAVWVEAMMVPAGDLYGYEAKTIDAIAEAVKRLSGRSDTDGGAPAPTRRRKPRTEEAAAVDAAIAAFEAMEAEQGRLGKIHTLAEEAAIEVRNRVGRPDVEGERLFGRPVRKLVDDPAPAELVKAEKAERRTHAAWHKVWSERQRLARAIAEVPTATAAETIRKLRYFTKTQAKRKASPESLEFAEDLQVALAAAMKTLRAMASEPEPTPPAVNPSSLRTHLERAVQRPNQLCAEGAPDSAVEAAYTNLAAGEHTAAAMPVTSPVSAATKLVFVLGLMEGRDGSNWTDDRDTKALHEVLAYLDGPLTAAIAEAGDLLREAADKLTAEYFDIAERCGALATELSGAGTDAEILAVYQEWRAARGEAERLEEEDDRASEAILAATPRPEALYFTDADVALLGQPGGGPVDDGRYINADWFVPQLRTELLPQWKADPEANRDRIARAEEVIAAEAQWTADREAERRALATDDLHRRINAACEREESLFRQVLLMPAITPRGIAAKAHVASFLLNDDASALALPIRDAMRLAGMDIPDHVARRATEEEAHQMVDEYVSAGGNFSLHSWQGRPWFGTQFPRENTPITREIEARLSTSSDLSRAVWKIMERRGAPIYSDGVPTAPDPDGDGEDLLVFHHSSRVEFGMSPAAA